MPRRRWRVAVQPRRRFTTLAAAALAFLACADLWLGTLQPLLRQEDWPTSAYWVAPRLALEGRTSLWYVDEAFRAAAIELGARGDIFGPNTPALALALLPLGALPERMARDIWLALAIAALLAAVACLARAARLSLAASLGVAALAAAFQPVHHNLAWGQAYTILLLGLVLGATWAIDRRPDARGDAGSAGAMPPGTVSRWRAGWRGVGAGLVLGLSGVLKFNYGLLMLAPVVAIRRWKAAAIAGVTLAGVAAVSIAAWGTQPWIDWLANAASWRTKPETAVTAYQTLNGMLNHLFRYHPRWNPGPILDAPAIAEVGWLACAAVLGMATILLLWRRRPGPADDAAFALLPFGLTLLTGLLLSPVAEDQHYVLTLFPFVVGSAVVARGVRARAGEARAGGPGAGGAASGGPGAGRSGGLPVAAVAALIIAALLIAPPWPFNVPPVHGWSALLFYPRVWGALVLWLLTAWALWRRAGAGTPSPAIGGPV